MEEEKRKIADAGRIREDCIKIGTGLLKKGIVNVYVGNAWQKVTELEPGTLATQCKCGKPFEIGPLSFYADMIRGNQGDKSAMVAILMDRHYGSIRQDQRRCDCGEVTNIVCQYIL